MTTGTKNSSSNAADVVSRLPERLARLIASGPIPRLVDRRWPLFILTSLLVSLFVSPDLVLFAPEFHEGEYVQRAIKARHAITVEDVESTRARREQAVVEAPPVYDVNTELRTAQFRRLDDAFDRMRQVLGLDRPTDETAGVGQVNVTSKQELADAQQRFVETLGADSLGPADFAYLMKAQYSPEFREGIRKALELAASGYLVGDLEDFHERLDAMPKSKRAFVARDTATNRETVETQLDKVIDFSRYEKDARALLRQQLGDDKAVGTAIKIALGLVSDNMTFNAAESEKRRQEAEDAVLPSMVKFARNQVIVGEGEKITREKMAIVEQVRHGAPGTNQALSFLATALLVFVVQMTLITFAQSNIRKFRLRTRDLLLLATVIVLSAFLSRMGKFVAGVVPDAVEFFPESSLVFLLPVASAAMVVRIILNSEVAFVTSVIIAIISGLLLGGDHAYALYVMIGSVAGAHFVARVSKRLAIIRAGVLVGLVNALSIVALLAFGGAWDDVTNWNTALDVAGGLVGGAFSGLMVLAGLAVFETVFGYTSNISLLELASLNHPLMKDMVVKAPGTYNHSSIVGSLAEAGAEAVGANPLLARVASIYHDVGKLNKPQYFSENYSIDDNPHDKLYPSMSVLILVSHVREGVEMARRHGLGKAITEIIRQHHGTALIKKHYDRAKAAAETKGQTVAEQDFRYPGPKPQTREAALVMLANAVEVHASSLPNPTPARLEQNIEETINAYFLDGQLAECDLTLKDLNLVYRAFLRVITGFYHSRIEYPEDTSTKKRERTFAVAEDRSHPSS